MFKAADLSAMEVLSCREKSSSSPWPPVWKSIEECPQHYFLVRYLEPFREKSTDPKTLLFYKQVEETRGYDVTIGIYNGLNPFSPEETPFMIEWFKLCCQAAVEHINEQAKMHDELYEFVEFVKSVPLHLRSHLMTFTVKKVEEYSGEVECLKTVQAFMTAQDDLAVVGEWRFKPDS